MKARILPTMFMVLVAAVACGKSDKSHVQQVAGTISLQSLTIDTGVERGAVRTLPFTVQDALVIEITLNAAPPADAGPIQARFINLSTGQVASTRSVAVENRQATLTLNPKDRREWEPGRYLLEVSLGSSLLGTRDIDISVPVPAG